VTTPEQCRLGLRIFTEIPRPTEEELRALSDAGSCDLSDVMRGSGVMDSGLRPAYTPMKRLFGTAITVDLTPGDGLLLRAAVDAARPGDVIVVNGHGETSRAVLGGVIAMHMVHAGVAGLIVDGAVRDAGEFRELDFPVYARAVTPRSGSTSAGWGEVNVPVACGGTVVFPGDVVVGDEEGIAVVPRLWAGEVARSVGRAGHPTFEPGTILQKLRELPADARVLGIDRVHRAVAERAGIIINDTYEQEPGPTGPGRKQDQ
jgi:RraA family protein